MYKPREAKLMFELATILDIGIGTAISEDTGSTMRVLSFLHNFKKNKQQNYFTSLSKIIFPIKA